MPVAEIQFRKYADPATEQIKNTGTIRWRTANRFAAPMVVRMPGGFAMDPDIARRQSADQRQIGRIRAGPFLKDPAVFV